MQDRAWSTFDLKSIDAEQRIIEGVASTPSVDRGGDAMDPKGAQFTLPMPLMWDHKVPIGEVFAATVKADGIHIKAKFSALDPAAPVSLRDRIEEAWHSVKAQPPLARGLSIGWKPLEAEPIKGTSFVKFLKWIWGETSVVVIPMNAEASITRVKELDVAASGPSSPAVVGTLPVVRVQKDAPRMANTIPDQISAFENTRAAKSARMNELMTKAAESGTTLDQAQTDEYDALALDVKSVDAHLTRLRDLEKANLATATRITTTPSQTTETLTEQQKAALLRGGGTLPQITVKPMLPKGTAFTRYVMAVAAGNGDSYRTMELAKQWSSTTPEVATMVELMPKMEMLTKSAVAAGSTTDATWAGPLAVVTPLVGEFLELLRPRTLIGRIPGMKKVPFNVSVNSQTTGGTYGWVGQNKPKPVTKADYAAVTLTFAKAAGIIVLTEELVKLSSPSAEELVREEMIAGMSQFLDLQFQDPAVAAVANVNPASITNGATTAAASGVTGAAAKADLAARVATFTAAGIPLEGSVWLMSDSNAFGLGLAINALGQPLFPGVGINGGSIFGIPIVVSNSLSTRVVLMHAPSILYADDGGVSIDVSREASVQMDSAPTDVVDATTVYVSLWQRNLVGLKAERFITWLRARTAAVTYITAAAYNGT